MNQVDMTGWLDVDFYSAVWDLLVEKAGASKSADEKLSFVSAHARAEKYPCTEYRFCGSLGFGGKFRRKHDSWSIDCYPESETPEILRTIAEVNAAILVLVEKHNPADLGAFRLTK